MKNFKIKPITEEKARQFPEKMGIGWLGNCYELEAFPMLRDLKEGYYTVDGQLFKIEYSVPCRSAIFLLFQTNDLVKWVEAKWQEEQEGMEEEEDDYYEPDCTACGDGGCFHCEPWRFI